VQIECVLVIELEPGPDPDFPDPVVRNPGILIKTGFSGFWSGKSGPGRVKKTRIRSGSDI